MFLGTTVPGTVISVIQATMSAVHPVTTMVAEMRTLGRPPIVPAPLLPFTP